MKHAAVDVVDDDALHPGTKGQQQMPDQIVRQRPLLGHPPHEHGDRRADGLINVDHKDLGFIAQENGKAALQRQNRPHLHFDDVFVHL